VKEIARGMISTQRASARSSKHPQPFSVARLGSESFSYFKIHFMVPLLPKNFQPREFSQVTADSSKCVDSQIETRVKTLSDLPSQKQGEVKAHISTQ
jgi:hypothetical protein